MITKTRPKGIFGVIRETFKSWNEDKAPRLAAALSYYTIFSIAPLLVLVIAITGFIVGNNTVIRDEILAQVQTTVGQQGAQTVNTLITNASKPRDGLLATVIGIVTLIFGATGVFNQLKDALNTIWEVAPKKGGGIGGLVKERISGFVMILGLGFLLLVSLVLSTALSLLNSYITSLLGNTGPLPILLNYGIQLVVIAVVFGAIFKGVPDVDIQWRDVLLGGVITAILFLVGQFLISLYLSKASPASTYGAAGSLVVILLWIYYSAQILFLGAEFTKVYSYARGTEVVPTENARPLTAVERIEQGIARPEDEARARPAPDRQPPAVSQPPAPVLHPAAAPIPVSGPDTQPATTEPQPQGDAAAPPDRPADTSAKNDAAPDEDLGV